MQELMFRHCEFSESNFMLHEQSEENKLSPWGRNRCAKTEFDVVSVVVKFIKCKGFFFCPRNIYILIIYCVSPPGCPQVWCSDQKSPARFDTAAEPQPKQAQQDRRKSARGQERPIGGHSGEGVQA